MNPTLSIIIPCYNESRTVDELLSRVYSVELPGWHKEIIVVDDASDRATREILERHASHVQLLTHKVNRGKGSAVQTGLMHATGKYCLIQDADLEYDPADFPALLAALQHADVVYGSRNLAPRGRKGGSVARAGVWFLTREVNALWHLRLTDVWTCYKLFPREAAPDFRAGRFDSELLFTAALARRGYTFAEVPIRYYARPAGEGKKIRYRDGVWAVIALMYDKLRHG